MFCGFGLGLGCGVCGMWCMWYWWVIGLEVGDVIGVCRLFIYWLVNWLSWLRNG